VLLVLPYADYEWHWVQLVQAGFPDHVRWRSTIRPSIQNWTESVQRYHPAPDRLKEDGIQMHARNYGIVARAISVVALPNYQKNGGGTAQGLRVATAMGIKLFDLQDEKTLPGADAAADRAAGDEAGEADRELLKAPGSAPRCVSRYRKLRMRRRPIPVATATRSRRATQPSDPLPLLRVGEMM